MLIALCTVIKIITMTVLSMKKIELKHSYLIAIVTTPLFIYHNYMIGEYSQMVLFTYLEIISIIGIYKWR